MTFLICAIGFPLLAGVLSLGCGLLVERAAGRLPGALLVPAGFAGIVVVSQLGTGLDLLSDVTPILVALLAVAGFALGRRRLAEGAVDWWAAGAAVAVYLLVAAPVLLSGTATFAAYGLDTTGAVQLMGADFLLHHAHDFSVLEPSAYAQTVVQYFEPGYPSGSHTAFAAIGWLTGQDLAWLYTEYMAFLVAVTVLGLYALVRRLPLSALACAAVAGIAAMPMLVYAYALQGAIKEMATLPVIALLAALVPWFADSWREHWSRVVPLAVACAAGLATIGVAFAPWLAPFALAGLVLTLRGGGRGALRGAGVRAAAFVVLLAVCALPALILGVGYVAVMMRYTRSAMLEVLGSLYVTTAEAKGLSPRVVVVRHALRNALIPIVTVIGLSLPDLVGGAVIIETVFSWPGLGLMMVEGVTARDYPMIMGLSLIVAVTVLLANLLTDVAYAVTDPRVRYD